MELSDEMIDDAMANYLRDAKRSVMASLFLLGLEVPCEFAVKMDKDRIDNG